MSLVPNLNGVIRDAVKRCLPGTPFHVLLTDFADFPPFFWMEPGIDRAIVGSERAFVQALETGLSAERVTRTSGMVLHPRFYPPPAAEARARVRSEMALGDAFVVLLLFGGKGSPEVRPLTEALLRECPEVSVVAICGDNPALYEASPRWRCTLRSAPAPLASGRWRAPRRVRPLVSKPGQGRSPGPSTAGAVSACNAHTIPQERYNARLVREMGLGLTVRHWREIPVAVQALRLDPARLAGYRSRVAALPPNRAVFEVLDLVARTLGAAGDARSVAGSSPSETIRLRPAEPA
jgi:1,2-diacylglycerol 3-beta-galactosyltransferase